MSHPTPLPSVADLPAPPADLPRAELSDNARIVLAKRYLKKDESGKPTEEPEEMFWRVAYTIAAADRAYGASEMEVQALAPDFYEVMTRRLFAPNSPTLMNAGRELGQLAACFVVPVGVSMQEIFDAVKWAAVIQDAGIARLD